MYVCTCCPNNDMTKNMAILSGKLNFRSINFLNEKKKLSVTNLVFSKRILGALNGLEFQN